MANEYWILSWMHSLVKLDNWFLSLSIPLEEYLNVFTPYKSTKVVQRELKGMKVSTMEGMHLRQLRDGET